MMGKFGDLAMIGALAGGGYLVYRFMMKHDVLGLATKGAGGFFESLQAGVGTIWGGISDIFGLGGGPAQPDAAAAAAAYAAQVAYAGPATVSGFAVPEELREELEAEAPPGWHLMGYLGEGGISAPAAPEGARAGPFGTPAEPVPEAPRWRLIEAITGEVQA